MATIFDFLSDYNCQCPVYTCYELGNAMKRKRENENMTVEEFAQDYDVDIEILKKIENVRGTFTPKMYQICSRILGISINDILAVENENVELASYRAESDSEAVNQTVEFANQLFHEIIMQRKIGIR